MGLQSFQKSIEQITDTRLDTANGHLTDANTRLDTANGHLGGVNQKLGTVEDKLTKANDHLSHLTGSVDRFDRSTEQADKATHDKLDHISTRISHAADRLTDGVAAVHGETEKIDRHLEAIASVVGRVGNRIEQTLESALPAVVEHFEHIRKQLGEILQELRTQPQGRGSTQPQGRGSNKP